MVMPCWHALPRLDALGTACLPVVTIDASPALARSFASAIQLSRMESKLSVPKTLHSNNIGIKLHCNNWVYLNLMKSGNCFRILTTLHRYSWSTISYQSNNISYSKLGGIIYYFQVEGLWKAGEKGDIYILKAINSSK